MNKDVLFNTSFLLKEAYTSRRVLAVNQTAFMSNSGNS